MKRETFFLKNHTQNVVEKLFSDPSQNKSKLSISLDQQSKVLYSFYCFYYMPDWGLSKYIETELQTTCFYLRKGFSKKQNKVWN